MIRACCLLAAAFLISCNDDRVATNGEGAERIVALAPHLAELAFAVGAGEQVVGVSAYTDYPPTARDIPVVSDAFTVDHEALLLLKPDLMLVWESGMPASTIGQLKKRGYPVHVVRTRSLDDIERAMRSIGELTGHAAEGNARADEFRDAFRILREEHATAETLTVFYQVSRDPLYTVNGQHYVSEILEICGARNVFSEIEQLAPNIDVEAVVSRNPQVIVSSDAAGEETLAVWRRFPSLAAVQAGNLVMLPGDLLGRPSDRVLIAAKAACTAIAQARARLQSS